MQINAVDTHWTCVKYVNKAVMGNESTTSRELHVSPEVNEGVESQLNLQYTSIRSSVWMSVSCYQSGSHTKICRTCCFMTIHSCPLVSPMNERISLRQISTEVPPASFERWGSSRRGRGKYRNVLHGLITRKHTHRIKPSLGHLTSQEINATYFQYLMIFFIQKFKFFANYKMRLDMHGVC